MSSSSLIFMASDETTEAAATVAAAAAKPEAGATATTKGRGRKPSSKAPNSKKQPQRGLGVAQLERLRLEERYKKNMTEMPQFHPLYNLPVADHHHHHFHFPPFAAAAAAEPLESVPVQYGAGGYGGGGTITHQRLMAIAVHQQKQLMAQHHHHHLGGGLFNSVGSSSGGDHVGMMGQDQGNHVVDSQLSYNGVRVESSSAKELSSIPKTPPLHFVPSNQPYHDYSDICANFKKKRFNRGMGEKAPDQSTLQMGFLRSISNSPGDLSLGCGTTTPKAPQNVDEGVEVVAVHRKGNNNPGGVNGGQVVMEYEFFPDKNDTDTTKTTAGSSNVSGTVSKEMVMQILPGAAEASYYATTTYIGADTISSNNHVDLSLKL